VAESVENPRWTTTRTHLTVPRLKLGDERLAGLVGDGDERAFATLYERYNGQLYRYCRSLLHDDLDAQDAIQAAFTSALSALRQRRRNAPLRPWLFRIAHNEAISMLRRRQRTHANSEEISDRLTVASAEERAAERARLAQLVDDLSELPERQRAALLMRELSDLSHVEIATALDTSIGAAKQAIFDARRTLMDFSQAREMPCAEVQRTISDRDGRSLRARAIRAHLRDCEGCAAFAAAIPSRQAELRAIVPPLAPAAALGLFARLGVSGAGHGNAAGGGAATAGAAGKAGGGFLASKATLGVLVAATAAAGVAGVTKLLPRTSHHGSSPARASVVQRAPGSEFASTPAGRAGRSRGAAAPRGAHTRAGATGRAGARRNRSTAGSVKAAHHRRASAPPTSSGTSPSSVSHGQSGSTHGQGLHLGHTLGPTHSATHPRGSTKPHPAGPKPKASPPGKANGLLKPHAHG
jgi:RNA polymerase sigma factor (sigma-70 family)